MSRKVVKKPRERTEEEKDVLLQAVIVTDSFHRNFRPVSSCTATLPLVNRKVLDYCLDWLNISNVNEVILFANPESVGEIKIHLRDKSFLNMEIKVLISEGCHSFGDVMRALDSYAIIRNTFILLSVDVIGNINFHPLINKFKSIQRLDKDVCMMLLLKEVGNRRTDAKKTTIIAHNSKNRLVHYEITGSKYVEFNLETVLTQDSVEVRSDLLNCGVAVCSVAVPPLFSDNFDFQSMNDLIKGLLSEELLQTTIYCEILNNGQYLAKVIDWPTYQAVSQDIVNRWCYPHVLDVSERYSYRKNSTYLKNVTLSKGCHLGFDVVIGNETVLGNNVKVEKSVIGNNCLIGEGVVIENSFIFDGTEIGNNSVIRFSVIGSNSFVKEKCILNGNCILGPGVVLETETNITNVKLVRENQCTSKPQPKLTSRAFYYGSVENDSEDEEQEVPNLNTNIVKFGEESDEKDDLESTDSDSDESMIDVALDDVKIFYNEVVDSLNRGFEDKLRCENLILEINSSRYAYNITVNEVNFNLVKAILKIEPASGGQSVRELLQHTLLRLKYFQPLINNYIKNDVAQRDCLSALENVMNSSPSIRSIAPKILQFWYDKNILTEDIILDWFSNLSTDNNEDIKSVLVPFINWLQDAEEESDE